ncbi:MAG: hypothetical protein J5764_06700, partial [Bacteroidales bacterium]|nr:hypothetical protein [Bacteroidales bacterium]
MDSRLYKTIVTILILSFSYLMALGQNERHTTLEHNVFLGVGLFAEGGDMGINQFPGISVRLSYGADIRFDKNWSVMPGASLTACKGAILRMWSKGGDGDGFFSADLFCQARWGFKISEGNRFVVGVGPEVSYMLVPVKYISESPSPYAGKGKIYRFNAGIKPG